MQTLTCGVTFGRDGASLYDIEFFPGTSRALEVSILRVDGVVRIVLSPFEHPTEHETAKWLSKINGTQLESIDFEPDDYFLPWAEQENKLLEALKAIHDIAQGTTVLILSHVCYATGMVIPVEGLSSRMRQELNGTDIRIIIDGAHFVGNGFTINSLPPAISYVFSAHKWLLAPDPCGVLVRKREAQPKPYDSWGDAIAYTTMNVQTLGGVLASLELLNSIGIESLWNRSRALKRQFLRHIESTFEVVGENAGLEPTLMVTIRPQAMYKWKDSDRDALAQYLLEKRGANVLVISIEPEVPWIRVAFPYFLEVWQVKELVKILSDTIESRF